MKKTDKTKKTDDLHEPIKEKPSDDNLCFYVTHDIQRVYSIPISGCTAMNAKGTSAKPLES